MCLHVIAVIQMKISDTMFRKQKCKLLQKVLKNYPPTSKHDVKSTI